MTGQSQFVTPVTGTPVTTPCPCQTVSWESLRAECRIHSQDSPRLMCVCVCVWTKSHCGRFLSE